MAHAARATRRAAAPRVGATVKERNEMTIGRTEDPGNPCFALAFEAASLCGLDRGTHLGQRTWSASTGRTQARIRPPSRSFFSCIRGAVHTCEAPEALKQSPARVPRTRRLLQRRRSDVVPRLVRRARSSARAPEPGDCFSALGASHVWTAPRMQEK